ncbi:MAG TPA: hypothetical protein VLE20_08735, partial [Blastocatellia bacterium]|nr:hypothetical protein [Blastocatellia bacterium]
MNRINSRVTFRLIATLIAAFAVCVLAAGFGAAADQQQESGKAAIGRSYKDSKPYWEPLPQAPKGAPNIIYL